MMNAISHARPARFDATIVYTRRTNERPLFAFDEMRVTAEPSPVVMHDARSLAEAPSLDREGFMISTAPTGVTDFDDKVEIESRYIGEVCDHIQTLTGASRVIPYPCYIYRQSGLESSGDARRLPAGQGAHIDFTSRSAHAFLDAVADAEALLKRYSRIAIYQTWRALSGAPQNLPLAVTDGRTVSSSDLIEADTRSPEELGPVTDFEFYLGSPGENHRWYYFRDMAPDEMLIFQGYDFNEPDRLNVLHTAFLDETCPPGAPPRRSIELRCFACFD